MLLQLTSPLSTALLELVNQLKLREIEFESGTEIVNLLQQQKGKSKENGLVASVSTVDHQLLVDLVKHCRQNGIDIRLASLLKLTDVYAPALIPRVRSEKLEAILAEIKLNQEHQLYNSYTSTTSTLFTPARSTNIPYSVHSASAAGERLNVKDEWKEINQQLSAITSVGCSMAAVGTGVWWVSAGSHFTPRLLLALTGAFLICIIESILYYRFFTREKPLPKKIKSQPKVFAGEIPTESKLEEKKPDPSLKVLKFD